MPKFTFFIGKGGVGKTTVAASYATWRAKKSRNPVLLISTDPAHSLGDVLQVRVSNRTRHITGRLHVREIDPRAEVRKFLNKQREGILTLIESGTLFSREEVEPLLDAAIPGMSEISALLAIHSLIDSRYEEVVLDTAPMGHTLRLFEMPAHFARFVEFLDLASSRDRLLAARFGGTVQRMSPTLMRWREMVGRVENALSRENTDIVLVTTPETFALNESARAHDYLRSASSELEFSTVVLNRAQTRAGVCPVCKQRARRTSKARGYLGCEFRKAKLLIAEDAARPVIGTSALEAFGRHVFEGRRLKLPESSLSRSGPPKLKRASWPAPQTTMTLTVGKGGVGKTTVSAGLAFNARQQTDTRVTVCSIDPAPSLDDVFGTTVGEKPIAVLGDRGLCAVELDAVNEYQRWAEAMRERISHALSSEAGGLHIDLSFDREVLLALLDIVPPGVDEIFALFRIFDLLHDANGQKLVIDMSPTGHALELLRTPDRVLAWCRLLLKTLAAHRTLHFARDAAVEIAEISQRVRELAARLRNESSSRFYVVMLAEPLPGSETRRLTTSLRQMSAPVAGIVVNRVLIGKQRCTRCSVTQNSQFASLKKIAVEFGNLALMLVPESPTALAGKRGLERLTSTMWQLA